VAQRQNILPAVAVCNGCSQNAGGLLPDRAIAGTVRDRAGLLVWAEISQVDRIDGSDRFAETSRSQLLDLIRQNVNHPSIFT